MLETGLETGEICIDRTTMFTLVDMPISSSLKLSRVFLQRMDTRGKGGGVELFYFFYKITLWNTRLRKKPSTSKRKFSFHNGVCSGVEWRESFHVFYITISHRSRGDYR